MWRGMQGYLCTYRLGHVGDLIRGFYYPVNMFLLLYMALVWYILLSRLGAPIDPTSWVGSASILYAPRALRCHPLAPAAADHRLSSLLRPRRSCQSLAPARGWLRAFGHIRVGRLF